MSTTPVRVAVGAIRNSFNQVLIALRPPHKHQGDLWEFPGGKIEPGESCEQALARELEEELGILLIKSKPLIQIPFNYPDKAVHLEVREVLEFQGVPLGREGQPLRWVHRSDLGKYTFPAANRRIVKALQLPPLAAITGDFADDIQFVTGLERALVRGAGMVQIRQANLTIAGLNTLLALAADFCQVPITVNSAIDRAIWRDIPGLHLRSCDLMSLSDRPVSDDVLLGASCHNANELAQAVNIQADYVFLSPVQQTASHPSAETLGWEGFCGLMQRCSLPVYALGGLCRQDLPAALASGAAGIAGITAFWR